MKEMAFDELLQHIMALTGLDEIKAARLLTGQILIMTDDMVMATADETLDSGLAQDIIALTAESVTGMEPLIK